MAQNPATGPVPPNPATDHVLGFPFGFPTVSSSTGQPVAPSQAALDAQKQSLQATKDSLQATKKFLQDTKTFLDELIRIADSQVTATQKRITVVQKIPVGKKAGGRDSKPPV